MNTTDSITVTNNVYTATTSSAITTNNDDFTINNDSLYNVKYDNCIHNLFNMMDMISLQDRYEEPSIFIIPNITKVEILKPNKVIRFTFDNKTTIKTICTDEDIFDFRFAFFVAYAKYFYQDLLTAKGIEKKAREFKDIKKFNTFVNKGMKVYLNDKKAKEKAEAEEKERKVIKARQAAKKAAKKAKKHEARIKEITEAIKNAID